VPFLALTLLIAALPLLAYVLLGRPREGGDAARPRVDDREQLARQHHRPRPFVILIL
jgi:hypothetical protein